MSPSRTFILKNTGLAMIISEAIHTVRNSFVTTMRIVTETIGMINMKPTRNGDIMGMIIGMGMETDIDCQRTERPF
ncbi:MAG TPA: hypothetical protein VF939_14315 [Puia sp.]